MCTIAAKAKLAHWCGWNEPSACGAYHWRHRFGPKSFFPHYHFDFAKQPSCGCSLTHFMCTCTNAPVPALDSALSHSLATHFQQKNETIDHTNNSTWVTSLRWTESVSVRENVYVSKCSCVGMFWFKAWVNLKLITSYIIAISLNVFESHVWWMTRWYGITNDIVLCIEHH